MSNIPLSIELEPTKILPVHLTKHQTKQKSTIQLIGILSWSIAAIFFLYEFFLRTFVGTIASQLIHDLHLSIEEFSLITSAYFLSYGIMQVPVGILVDKLGVRKVIIFATLICTLSVFLFGHSQGVAAALLARFLMGFGASFGFVCLLAITIEALPRHYFGFFAGVSQFVGALGPILAGGPFIDWLTASHSSWRLLLNTVGYIGIGLVVVMFILIKDNPPPKEPLNTPATKPLIIQLKTLFSNKQVWWIACYSGTGYVAIAIMTIVWGTYYLQAVGLSQARAAYMISIAWLAYAIGCPVFGFLSDLIQRRKLFLILCALLGIISLSLLLYAPASINQSPLLYELAFMMLGLAATGQNLGFAAIVECSSPEVKATALGLNNALISFFSLTFPPLIGYIIALANGSYAATHLSPEALRIGLSLLPVSYCIALLIALFLFKETHPHSQRSSSIPQS